jgi:peptidoglycan/xylan/chitin deacetylase (PgdA/CDA1 family)
MGNNCIKRKVKIAISVIYFVVAMIVRSGLHLFGRSPAARLVVLYYHGVPAEFRLNFKRQMDALQRRASVIPASYRGSLPPGKKHVAITFDDALDNIIENALPELACRGFHATVFVPVGWIGRRPYWQVDGDDLGPDDVVMSLEQLRRLDPSLVSLGAHTVTHPLLSKLDKKHLREEIEGSRDQLAEMSGRDIQSFSFPYGDHDASCLEMCKAARYDSVFSIVPEDVDTASSEILRGRTSVDPSDGAIEFFLKFNGAYVWAAQLAPITRQLRAHFTKTGRSRSKRTKQWRTMVL